jgi:hypothetical protein
VRLLAYLTATLAFAAVAHIAWSLLLAAGLLAGFDHRIFNTRAVAINHGTRLALSAAFLDHRTRGDTGRTVGFLGSSFTYGYPWEEDRIFSDVFAAREPTLNVFNGSQIGSDIGGIIENVACPLAAAKQKVAVAFFEIPIVNTVDNLEQYRRLGASRPPVHCLPPSSWSGFVPIFLSRPFGVGWLPLLWDPERYAKPDEPISIAPLPPEYFGSLEEFEAVLPQYRQWLADAAAVFRKAAAKVYVYPTPIYIPGVKEAGGDEQAAKRQFQTSLELCRSLVGIICLDTSGFLDRREYFYNLTHLNQRGHRAFAEWLLAEFQAREHDDAITSR